MSKHTGSLHSPSGYNPVVGALQRVCAPAPAPIRRVLPGMGGIDFSPLLFILGVHLVLAFLPGAGLGTGPNSVSSSDETR